MGTRLGAEVPKAYVELQGRTLLERSVAAMAHSGVVKRAVVTVSPAMEDTARALLADAPLPITLVHGGGERADSVWAGLQAIDEEDAVDEGDGQGGIGKQCSRGVFHRRGDGEDCGEYSGG